MRVGDAPTGPRRLDGARRGRILVQGQVRSDPMVILQVELKRSSESPFIPHDDVIQSFPPWGADQTFGEGILPRRSRRNEDVLDVEPFQEVAEVWSVDTVSVSNGRTRYQVRGVNPKKWCVPNIR